jgi:hypothetical protein
MVGGEGGGSEGVAMVNRLTEFKILAYGARNMNYNEMRVRMEIHLQLLEEVPQFCRRLLRAR